MAIKSNSSNISSLLNDSINYNEYTNISSQFYDPNKIFFYFYLVTVPIGLSGNVLSILIFTRPVLNKKTNTGRLYTLLCILCIIRIVFQAFCKRWENFLEFLTKWHFNSEVLFESLLLQSLSWTQLLTSFDRFIYVFYPVKGARIMRKKKQFYIRS